MSLRLEIPRSIAAARDRAIADGTLTLADGASLPPVGIERPANPDHGDWASNAAMQLAPVLRAAPMRIADAIREHFEPPASVAEVSVAAPGFLNFRLDPAWVAAQVGPIRAAGPTYGRVSGGGRRINVEFVSANPTGPLHVGNARGAFVGDVLSRVLDAAGHDVTREYYFNDFGGQVKALGASVRALRTGQPIPEDGYRGDYVKEMAASVPAEVVQAAEAADGDEADWVYGRWASEVQRAGIESSLEALGVAFDVWKNESSVHDEGWVERAVAALRDAGHVYEGDGATWFRATAFGEDQDRVIYRSNGQPTYFAADIGYVGEKFSRGFDELIYVWGENHHGAIARLMHASEALGHDPTAVRILLYSLGPLRARRHGGEHEQAVRRVHRARRPACARSGPMRSAGSSAPAPSPAASTSTSSSPSARATRTPCTTCSTHMPVRARSSSTQPTSASRPMTRAPASSSSIRPSRRSSASCSTSRTRSRPPPNGARRTRSRATRTRWRRPSARSTATARCSATTGALSSARLSLVDATRVVIANALDLLGISAPESM